MSQIPNHISTPSIIHDRVWSAIDKFSLVPLFPNFTLEALNVHRSYSRRRRVVFGKLVKFFGFLEIRAERDLDQVVAEEVVRGDDVRPLPESVLEEIGEIAIHGIGEGSQVAGHFEDDVENARRQFRHQRPERILADPRILRIADDVVEVLDQIAGRLLVAPSLAQWRPQPIVACEWKKMRNCI